MACVGSVKHPTRSNQPWELDGLYTIEKTDGIEYRGKFFCAQRIIDFVIEEAAKTDTETIEVVVSCMHGRGGVGGREGHDMQLGLALTLFAVSSLRPSQAMHLSVYRDLLRRDFAVPSRGAQYNKGTLYRYV